MIKVERDVESNVIAELPPRLKGTFYKIYSNKGDCV